MTFTPVTSHELPQLFALYKSELFAYIEATFGWDENFQRKRFEDHYKLEWFRWIKSSNDICGFVCFHETEEKIHLSLLILDRQWQGKGMGSSVMQELIGRGKPMTLSSFRENLPALAFYTGLGFVLTKEDEHFVELAIAPSKPCSIRHHILGSGWEPHVDEIDRKLIYSLPVDSSYVTLGFEFEINREDLIVLTSDLYRYSALYFVLHSIIQNTFGPNVKNPRKYTQSEFDEVKMDVLHSSSHALQSYLQQFSIDHNMDVDLFIQQIISRKNAER